MSGYNVNNQTDWSGIETDERGRVEMDRQSGFAAIIGGILYVVSWGLEDTTPALSDGGSLYWLIGVVGLWGVHARYGAQYGRVGRSLAYLMGSHDWRDNGRHGAEPPRAGPSRPKPAR